MPPRTLRLVLAGLGNVNRNFLRLMQSQRNLLRDVYGLELVVAGAADSSGAVVNDDALDPAALLAHKEAGGKVATFAGASLRHVSLESMIEAVPADMLLEATPVNLQTGQPGLDLCRAALEKGMHVVLANKGPLALAYQELLPSWPSPQLPQAARPFGRRSASPEGRGSWVRFSACVGGALPTINVGVRDLAGSRILKVEAAVNGTSQGILRLMESGVSFDDALAEMQRRGVVESDPSLDIDGWDEAEKLVIIANAVLRQPTTIHDLDVQGIRDLTANDLQAALQRGERIVLLGIADGVDGRYKLSVKPASLPLSHPLARMGADEMGVVYHTDISGIISAFSAEMTAMPTAAAMLRDVIDIATEI
jgi:homoserine dehydrogenase